MFPAGTNGVCPMLKSMLNITTLTKGLDYISYTGISSRIDSAKNVFSKWISMDKKYRTARTRAYNKLKAHDRHSMIPDMRLGDKYKQKIFNIRNVFIYYHEAMTTPCTLYCNRLTSKVLNNEIEYEDYHFYKIGISATRNLQDPTDTTDLGKIKYRMIEIRKDFQKRNRGLSQHPLFVVHSNVFNCVLLEAAFHKSIVFNGAISKIFYYFGGITECSKFLDFDMIDRLYKKSLVHNFRNQKEFYLEKERFFKRHNVQSFQKLDSQQRKVFTKMCDRFELNKYEWKIINKQEIDNIKESHKGIVRAYQNSLDLISFQNWIRLYNSQHSQWMHRDTLLKTYKGLIRSSQFCLDKV